MRWNFRTREFEDLTIKELREIVEGPLGAADGSDESEECWRSCQELDPPPGLEDLGVGVQAEWFDNPEANLWEEESSDKPADLVGCAWRSEPEKWKDRNWVKVDSVVDSGASTPVAPPTMVPNVPIRSSEGQRRGQKFTSASKHKLPNLGQQKIYACTEDGEETSVLFQIADASKLLASVSAICERGNRVTFGRSGGVVKNLKTGKEIPLYKKNGIYILSLWLMDSADEDFARP